jgi:pyrimidine operon attenuation protein / uracil phosphoribosyltransferase
MAVKNYILDAGTTQKKLLRMAYEIAERNMDEPSLVLAGIKDSGVVMAHILKSLTEPLFKGEISVIEVGLDKRTPGEITLSDNRSFNNEVIILVDDVANSGKTMLYALKPFLAFYPKKIQTLVLVERSHKAFPIQADYVGLTISTALQEHIFVELTDEGIGGAWME